MVMGLASALGLLLSLALSLGNALAQSPLPGPVLINPVESAPLPPPSQGPAAPDEDDEDEPGVYPGGQPLPPRDDRSFNRSDPSLNPSDRSFTPPYGGRFGNAPSGGRPLPPGVTGAVPPSDAGRPGYPTPGEPGYAGPGEPARPGVFGRQPAEPGAPTGQPLRPAEIQPGDPVGPFDILIDPLRRATRAPVENTPAEPALRPPMDLSPERRPALAALPPEDQPEEGEPKELPAHLKRQLVDYPSKEPAGTLIIDTANTYLYLVLGGGKAMRYGIGVGRDGFTWSGRERVSRMTEWPDWYPPSDMIERQPYLPRMMAGGAGNPLGARALYLGKTLYRIHGTNQPSTIGKFVSSGCIRMLNEDVMDLYQRVTVGSQVVVLAGKPPASASAAAPTAGAAPAPGASGPSGPGAASPAAPAPAR
jgi:lipoprotein-anchoring transpeptidase ErfK/SrfK